MTAGQVAQSGPHDLARRLRTLNWNGMAIVATLGVAIGVGVGQLVGWTPVAQDAAVYWNAHPGSLYPESFAWRLAPYGYSPAFADALVPAQQLPLRVFTGLWQFGLVVLLAVVARGWALPILVLGFIAPWPFDAVTADIAMGNIHVLIGAIAIFGLRWPGLWSIVLLSKVTPGVALIWFVARKEWRNLAIALGVTAIAAITSFALLPGDWFAWIDLLQSGNDFPLWVVPISLPVRLAMSAALVWWGARTDRPWVVPIACGWAIPLPYATMLACMVAAIGARYWFQELRPRTGRPSLAVDDERVLTRGGSPLVDEVGVG